jgi:heme exporter protein C
MAAPNLTRTNVPRAHPAWQALLFATALGFVYHLYFIFFRAPEAQEAAGGLAQKIFYFHVPAAYALYVCGAVCFVASCAYLLRPTHARNAWARAGAEGAVVFGLMVLVSGPLWAKKAWGVYWTWDPRLTTLLLAVLLYLAMVVLRRFTGDGDAERKFAAAFGVLGTSLLPVIHYSVQLWGGNHPTVMGKGGGGLGSADMYHALFVGFGTMTLLSVLLLTLRAQLALIDSRLRDAEELAAALGYWDEPALDGESDEGITEMRTNDD